MNIYLYMKGSHALKVIEQGNNAKIQGVTGSIDSIDLLTMLQGDGYQYIKTLN